VAPGAPHVTPPTTTTTTTTSTSTGAGHDDHGTLNEEQR
jgi:hypothetical protein